MIDIILTVVSRVHATTKLIFAGLLLDDAKGGERHQPKVLSDCRSFVVTPWKINMEHRNGVLVHMIFLFN